MKKIIAIVPDTAVIDLTSLIENAVEFKIELVANGNGHAKPCQRKVVRGKSTESVILEHFSPQALFDLNRAEEWLTKQGYAQKSAASALSRLKAQGKLASAGKGKWRFVAP